MSNENDNSEDIEIVQDSESQNNETTTGAPNETSLQDEVLKWKNEYLYLKAEFDNYKKQMIKERSDLLKYGAERILGSLLDVLDAFDKAIELDVNSDNLDSFLTGIKMTHEELKNALQKFGVTEIYPSGKPFDPSLHEALSSQPTNDVEPGHVVTVFRRGYKLHDRVIRPAQVVVAQEIKSETDNN